MTHAAPRKRGGKTWLLPTLVAAAVAGAVAGGLLSRSLALDAISWWPIWLFLAGFGFWGRSVRIGPLRVPGLVGMATAAAIALLVIGHLQGWPVLPSAAAHLDGSSSEGVATAALSARAPEGRVVISAGNGQFLYDVEPVRRGGSLAMATAVERAQDDNVAVELFPKEEAGLFLWSGWSIRLSTVPVWSITLEGEIAADLTSVSVENLQVIGNGALVLGDVSRSTPVTVGGDFTIEVPEGTPVRVIGAAQIPEGWERTESGASSPVEGHGWVISVSEGSVVRITTA